MSDSAGNLEDLTSPLREFFFGRMNEEDFFPYPEISEEENESIQVMIDAFKKCAEQCIDTAKMDQESLISDEVYKELADLGMMGFSVPEEYGGLGMNHTFYALISAKINEVDSSITAMLGAHQSIGYKALIYYGTEEQKKKYLPKLASGEMIASFCLTEPGSGSDAYSIKTKAVENSDGSFSITGQKLWITNAGRSDFYTVFCKTDHQKDGKTREKISCFIVEKDMPGLSFGEKEKKMGIRASETRAIFFDQVRVPRENIIGELGQGFRMAMTILNFGRLALSSACLGGMERAIQLATAHASQRKQFGKKLNEFGIIQDKLARMLANFYAAESFVYYVTRKVDQGQGDYALEAAVGKVFCSERGWDTIDMALQIAGGTGYMQEYPYEQMMRDFRINLIFEGTNEILRVFLALSGMKDLGETMKDLGRLASDVPGAFLAPVKSVGILSSFAKGRIDKMIPKTISKCHPDLKEDASYFCKMLSSFAIEAEDILLKYGKKVVDNELPQKRVADMLIALSVSICVISRTTSILNNEKIDQKKKDYTRDIAKLALKDLRHSFMAPFREMGSNLDSEIVKVVKQSEESEGLVFDILSS